MKLIAAMDIRNGKCVQLTQGKIETSKVYSSNPVEVCKSWGNSKIDKIHIVDLDGVFSGKTQMYPLLKELKNSTHLPIQFGGGIRDYETAKKILDLGIDQIVLGTSALKDQDLLIQLLSEFPDRIIVAVDVYKGFVYVEGWEENSSISLLEFINTLELINVKTIMVTDISKDGTLGGGSLNLLDDLLKISSLSIILSGGISSDSDVKELSSRPIEGLVIGKALYEGLITI